jgi:hypothetical protein
MMDDGKPFSENLGPGCVPVAMLCSWLRVYYIQLMLTWPDFLSCLASQWSGAYQGQLFKYTIVSLQEICHQVRFSQPITDEEGAEEGEEMGLDNNLEVVLQHCTRGVRLGHCTSCILLHLHHVHKLLNNVLGQNKIWRCTSGDGGGLTPHPSLSHRSRDPWCLYQCLYPMFPLPLGAPCCH